MKRPHRQWAQNSIATHKRRGFDIRITWKRLEEIAKATTRCLLCGVELNWGPKKCGHLILESPTLDRINNEDYISEDNTMIVCWRCNSSKQSRTLKEFIDYCKLIVDHEKTWRRFYY